MNRHRYHTSRMWLVFIFVLMLVCGCPEESGQVAEGGIEGTGKSIGPISGFGSVHVNGVRLDTTDTSFIFEGQPGSERQLFHGMVINATSDEPSSASTIEFHFNLVGALEADDDDCEEGNLTAVEQQIRTDELTVLRNADLNDLHCGEVVAVSGFHQADGGIVATYLEKLDVTATLFNTTILEGLVDALDEQALTFKIGEQLVEYSAAQLTGFSDGTIENGLDIRVVGREVDGSLVATSVENLKDLVIDSTVGSVDISGFVTAAGIDSFVLGNTSINLTPGTVLKNGALSDIVANARLLARASRNDAGALVADEIIFAKQVNVSVESPVQAVDFAQGTVTLAGLTVTVNSFTLVLDRSSAQQTDFSLDDVNTGDRLIVFGFEQGERTILASRLERVSIGSSGDSARIEGNVGSSINDPVFFIAGLQIDSTDLQVPTGFFEGDVIPITRADFFKSLQPADRVRVSGLPQVGFLSATRVASLNFGNMSVLDVQGFVFGGTNDVVAVWDGTLNTQADIINGTLRENMTIQSASGQPFFGFPVTIHDVHVFGPGSHSIDTCNAGVTPPSCGPLAFTVPPGHLGAHMLFDWNISANIDVAVVWDINGQFPADQLYPGPAGPAPSPDAVWSLVSVDGDGDGIPGVALVDGPFIGFSWNLNLNIPPQSIGIDVQPRRPFKRIKQSSEASVPVAIVSRDALDATRVDPATISISDPTGRLAGTTSDYMCRDEDVNRDGVLDLVCKVEMTMESTGAHVLHVDANTLEGLRIHGEDSVLVVP